LKLYSIDIVELGHVNGPLPNHRDKKGETDRQKLEIKRLERSKGEVKA
jgi:hypothetical protein